MIEICIITKKEEKKNPRQLDRQHRPFSYYEELLQNPSLASGRFPLSRGSKCSTRLAFACHSEIPSRIIVACLRDPVLADLILLLGREGRPVDRVAVVHLVGDLEVDVVKDVVRLSRRGAGSGVAGAVGLVLAGLEPGDAARADAHTVEVHDEEGRVRETRLEVDAGLQVAAARQGDVVEAQAEVDHRHVHQGHAHRRRVAGCGSLFVYLVCLFH